MSDKDVLKEINTAGPEERIEIFKGLSILDKKVVLLRSSQSVIESVVAEMEDEEITGLLRKFDPDEGADILGYLDEDKRENILEKMESGRRERLNYLLGFDPETAAGLMDLAYITVNRNSTFGEVSDRIKRFEKKRKKFPAVLVVSEEGLVGELPGHAISIQDNPQKKIDEHVKPLTQIKYDSEEDEVIQQFRNNPRDKMVVQGEDGSILGVIRSEDVLRVLEERSTETLYDFASVSEEESVWDSPLEKVKNRYKWLILNLGTAFLAASVVSLFQATIEAFVLLAVYMPIVAGMGGNAGTQTMAVTIRGLTLGEIDFASGKMMVLNEVSGSLINGAINGLLISLVAIFINKSPVLGVVLATSMIINLGIAGFFGASIPLTLKKANLDPATSATIFITTATDVLGFFVFLGLAQMLI
ncbi:MAG: magnesium transporter [Candidatus Natronoplasma sp.]